MQQEIFADAIGEISLTNNVVRIDFVSLSPTECDQNNKPKAVFRQRVVMPVSTFGNSADLIRKVMEEITRSGMIRREVPTIGSPAGPRHARSLSTTPRAAFREADRCRFPPRQIFL